MQNEKPTALVWLRNDLRINDQQSFALAAKSKANIVAYYSFDPSHFETTPWGFKKTEAFRAQFLIETLTELRQFLLSLNISLIVDFKDPVEGIEYWVNELNVNKIYFQKEWTEEERLVEEKLRAVLKPEVNLHSHYDQFLFHPEDIPFELNLLPEIFTHFRKQCEKMSSVRQLPNEILPQPEENLIDQKFIIPSLADLGLEAKSLHPNSAFPFKGGSVQAKQRIDHYFWNTKKLSFYKQTRNGLVGNDYSSKFSAWLANGSISPRQIYWEIITYEKEIQKNQSTYWLIFELIWRDYFKYISLKHQDMIFHLGGILKKEYYWENDPEKVKCWIQGKTRESFVNANMIELQKTGWMSNRGRQNVASYFAKDLVLDWRIGAAYFESQLIDYDVHSNYGNWMYVAGVGNDPRDRKFNVRMQAERYDEGGNFQRIWNQNTLFE
ncbi:DASH family cryptochrome [Flavobacteriaceae bacterium]|nr:DASH family cryptochrome [Flavobacteriaceae bacterium]